MAETYFSYISLCMFLLLCATIYMVVYKYARFHEVLADFMVSRPNFWSGIITILVLYSFFKNYFPDATPLTIKSMTFTITRPGLSSASAGRLMMQRRRYARETLRARRELISFTGSMGSFPHALAMKSLNICRFLGDRRWTKEDFLS